jgi:hypothetical protein
MAVMGESLTGPLVIGGVALMLLAGLILLLMPTLFGAVLVVWLLVSIPIGIAVGHCVLGDDE